MLVSKGEANSASSSSSNYDVNASNGAMVMGFYFFLLVCKGTKSIMLNGIICCCCGSCVQIIMTYDERNENKMKLVVCVQIVMTYHEGNQNKMKLVVGNLLLGSCRSPPLADNTFLR